LRVSGYAANEENQITSFTVPGYIDILGSANSNATVTVNSQATYRKGEYFRKELKVDNSVNAVWQGITNVAVLQQGETNPDIVATNSGFVFVAKTPQVLQYDADGNLTNDSHFSYSWDGENRLLRVESLASTPMASRRKVEWQYDGKGRRIRQTEYDGSSGSWVVVSDIKMVYDGWNLVAEMNRSNYGAIRSYVWGLDLSGTQTDAGGVGGLLMVMDYSVNPGAAHFAAYDGNGNITALVKNDGTVSARY